MIAAQTYCGLFSNEGTDANFPIKSAVGSCIPAWNFNYRKENDLGGEPLTRGGYVGAPLLISRLVIAPCLGQVEPLLVNVDLIKHIGEHFTPHVYVVQAKLDPIPEVISSKGRL